jgi:hypothetical protein
MAASGRKKLFFQEMPLAVGAFFSENGAAEKPWG